VKHHQININRTPAQPEGKEEGLVNSDSSSGLTAPAIEVLDALRASMKAQVAALSEDNWMYEPEEQPRGQ
jgi:hypothetical protein